MTLCLISIILVFGDGLEMSRSKSSEATLLVLVEESSKPTTLCNDEDTKKRKSSLTKKKAMNRSLHQYLCQPKKKVIETLAMIVEYKHQLENARRTTSSPNKKWNVQTWPTLKIS